MSKIIFDPTSEEAKALVGKQVEFSDHYSFTEKSVDTLTALGETALYPFRAKCGLGCTFIRAIPEPTYAERQAKWVAENGVKVGTRVRFFRRFESSESYDDSLNITNSMQSLVGTVGVVTELGENDFLVDFQPYRTGNDWYLPFTALELVRETYRPFANAKEFEPHREKWLKVRESNTRERTNWYDDNGILSCHNEVVSYANLLKNATFEDGSKCGVLV